MKLARLCFVLIPLLTSWHPSPRPSAPAAPASASAAYSATK